MKQRKSNRLNIANKITLLRIAMIPFFVVIYYIFGRSNYLAAALFIIASLTDMLDGYFARSRNLVTTFGKFLDPLADKMLVTAALVLLAADGVIPAWAVILILSREFIITGFRTIAAAQNVTLAAGPWGKLKTITQLVAVALFLLNTADSGGAMLEKIALVLFYVSVALTVYSGVDYLWNNRTVLDLDNM